MGNPLLDISAEVDQAMLDKYNVKVNNAILAEPEHLPVYEELKGMAGVEFIAGGSTQNTARVAEWIAGSKGKISYMGCIGNDEFGKVLEKSAKADGVNVHYLVDEKVATGTCAVLVNGKDRSLIANLAAANEYKNTHLMLPENQALMTAASIYYNAGFFLTVSPESAMAMAAHAAAENKTYSLNLSAPFICEVPIFKDRIVELLPFCDFLFGNESEAESFGKSMGFEDTTVAGVAKRLAALEKKNTQRPRYVVFTQGKDCTIVACNDGTVVEYPVPEVPAEEIVDSNGAGDSFVGGFMAQYMQGKSVAECVRCGHWAAGVIIRRSGCSFPATADFQ